MDINQINSIAWKGVAASGTPKCFRAKYRHSVYRLSRQYADLDWERKRKEARGDIIDCEPWPFSDPKFCPWKEDDTNEHYSLFPNPAGFVTGHPTAYVSAMIRNVTGRWPLVRNMNKCKSPENARLAQSLWVECPHQYDSKNWASFLALNGYTEHPKTLQNSHYYVGIDKSVGEFGLVVWFEHLKDEATAVVSTRIDKKFEIREVKIADLDWVRISRHDMP